MSDEALPPGYVWVTARTTYLQMFRPNGGPPDGDASGGHSLAGGFRVERWENPPLDRYRDLFRAVGGPWGWTGRLLMTDAELRTVLSDPAIEVWRIHAARDGEDVVAGFIELDGRTAGEVEIVYFGFRPEFVGQGLGGKTLHWAADHVWRSPDVRRFWLHTCDFDHPKALAVYQRAGFEVVDERVGPEAYPAEHVERLAKRTND